MRLPAFALAAFLVGCAGPTVHEWIERLGSPSFAVQGEAAEALERLGPAAEPALREARWSGSTQVSAWADRILARLPKVPGERVEPGTVPGRDLPGPLLAALKWLARHQDLDGSWEPARSGARSNEHELGVTALALLAFLGAGFGLDARDEYEGLRFGDVVRKGFRWLAGYQRKSGLIRSRPGRKYMYDHALGTLALAEAVGDPAVPEGRKGDMTSALRRAVAYLCDARSPGGAWRYAAGSADNDSSVTSWCVLALARAARAGVKVPEEAFEGALAWLDEVTEPHYYRVGYTARGTGKVFLAGVNEHFSHHETLAAAGGLCRILADPAWRAKPQVRGAVDLVLRDLPRWELADIDFYYWYYASAFLSRIGTPHWDEWSGRMGKILTANQAPDGSWPAAGRWASEGGRAYAVAINSITLEFALGLRD